MPKGIYKRKPFTEKHKENIREIMKGKTSNALGKHWKVKDTSKQWGEKNHFWKGGISVNLYPEEWKENIRQGIRKRDEYVCQLCGIHQHELKGWNRQLDVHHKDYDKDNLNPTNLISLCRSCHVKTNHNRKYWMKYFENL